MVKEEFSNKGYCHGLPLLKGELFTFTQDSGQDASEKQLAPQYDPVERPAHYTQGPMEVIDIIEQYGFCDDFRLGNCIKYLFRHNLKGTALQDLKKARWYLDRYINALEKVETKG